MGAPLALLICAIVVAGLFYLDRDKSARVSKGLWLPTIWMWIVGSRPISMWLGISGPSSGAAALNATLEGSPLDAAIFEALIAAAVVVLVRRKKKVNPLLKSTLPVLLFFVYCLMSVAWSPYPESAFKRWIKCVGDLVMVLVIVTDPRPIAALRRLFSRVGFVLFPLSIVLIKWTNLGVMYDETGPHFTGVTTNKNTFGLMLYVVAIGLAWNLFMVLSDKKAPNRPQRLIAHCAVLVLGILLLHGSRSATSLFCFILGSFLIFATGMRMFKNRPGRVHALCLGILLMGVAGVVLGGGASATAMGRTADFSGRTEIWAAAIASADSPLIGTGFESFWNANSHKVVQLLVAQGYEDISNLNSAHDGYLQIYLDLGWVGVFLLSTILIGGYLKAVKAFQRNREMSCLGLAYIITCAFYNITEAGFRILTPSWFSLLLAVISSSAITIGLIPSEERKSRVSRGSAASKTIESNDPVRPARVAFATGSSTAFQGPRK
ncbi:O-antigen ligase family protein [Terracidiphilus gabretensis]|uniref:O-antigen ligase family protein n=1 Tax=Terracidiphilus gabretensis TaxID=1577687 RepID=UPI00071B9FAC|nr:O-antigen ligase family protein [Terracidiphilus gabretensis]